MDVNIDIAAAYLQGNCGLKSALGIESDCSLNVQLLGMGEHNINYVFTRPADGLYCASTWQCSHSMIVRCGTNTGH